MEPFAGELVAEALTEAGVDVRTGTSVESVTRENGTVVVVTATGDRIEADEILFATGRAPRTDDIGLDTIGLEPGDWLDGRRQPAGDRQRLALRGRRRQPPRAAHPPGQVPGAHRRRGDRRPGPGAPVQDRTAWGAHAATADHDAVPQVVFTDPEVGRGRPHPGGGRSRRATGSARSTTTSRRCRGRRRSTPTATGGGPAWSSTWTARSCSASPSSAPASASCIHSATIAVAGEVPISRLWHAVPSYPTISEVWLRLLEAYRDN